MNQTKSNYFTNLEVGSLVVVKLYTESMQLRPVIKVQQDFFFVENAKYRKKDGTEVYSDDKGYPTIVLDSPNETLIAHVKSCQLAEDIRNVTWRTDLTLDQLTRAKAILDETR